MGAQHAVRTRLRRLLPARLHRRLRHPLRWLRPYRVAVQAPHRQRCRLGEHLLLLRLRQPLRAGIGHQAAYHGQQDRQHPFLRRTRPHGAGVRPSSHGVRTLRQRLRYPRLGGAPRRERHAPPRTLRHPHACRRHTLRRRCALAAFQRTYCRQPIGRGCSFRGDWYGRCSLTHHLPPFHRRSLLLRPHKGYSQHERPTLHH